MRRHRGKKREMGVSDVRPEVASVNGGAGAMAQLYMSPAELSRFICIYPAYINNKKTIAEGRRIPVEKAVSNPTCAEIEDVCKVAGFTSCIENKMFPREWNRDVQFRGRVRVQLKKDDGSPCLAQFPTRKSVMLYVAEMIPRLKTRTQKAGGGEQSVQQGEGGKKGKKKKK
uniref:Signal recognition particle 19 kDa protein n=1 Tax=Geotrypetes seraphini TaxID=260995 RepID=A0A6P8P6W2_GEOSA|nr:signal recognition particle 19 kDa protein [Geotrypetes seraphini]